MTSHHRAITDMALGLEISMGCLVAIRTGLVLLSVASMVHAAPILAGQARTAPGPMAMQSFDWNRHTSQTLEELENDLVLAPEQKSAWQTWSDGVRADAARNLEGTHPPEDEDQAEPADSTTPQRMALGIARLRAHLASMQEHLKRLEAAQGRTETFYAALDAKQKNIFDLFWRDMPRRMAGHCGWGMNGRGEMGPGPMGHGLGPDDHACER